MRIFSLTITDGYSMSPTSATVTVDDSRYGMTLEIDGRSYDFSGKNVIEMREILGQIEDPPST